MSAVGRRFANVDATAISGSGATSHDASEIVDAVSEAAKGLRFGSIEVVVHEGRVVQVVRTEKRRVLR